jgi:hypothetical protein
MNKSALKTFATNARKELLKKVEAKAMKIGVTEDNIKNAEIESSDAIFIDGKRLSKEEKSQRDKLIARINQIGFKQVMEEVAYTWFNRFTALRYMEVNEYLPTDVRVLSSSNPNSADPDMIDQVFELDLEIDKEYVYELKLNNKTEELFKYLIIKHCNDLNRYLPFMFETIDDYTEILFPEGLLAKDTVIRHMTNKEFIPEDNWEKVEVIGWLYQYYIAEEKDRVIQAKKKYKTEEIPFATQLFTPDWIVRYMVQNSLGRYWIEAHPDQRNLLDNWEYYLERPKLEENFDEKLASYINKELKVEDIMCFDPAMGSGHILVYMFDLLYEIYSKCGYMEREIPRLILEKNLYGLDIDNRAYQLACFSVVMKAVEYNSNFFRSIERDGLVLNLASIQESNILNDEVIAYISGEYSGHNFDKTKEFMELFNNAKTIGSLVRVESYNQDFLSERLEYIQVNPANDLFEEEIRKKVLRLLPNLIKQAEIMCKQYDILVTNPPYMSNKYMNSILEDYIKKNYKETKSDTFSAFMDFCFKKVGRNGHLGFLTPLSWMFINSYEKLRKDVINNNNISSLIQLEYNAFPEACVPVCCFTVRNYSIKLNGEYIKLSDFKGSENQKVKTIEAIKNPNVDFRYTRVSQDFSKIKGYPIAYWVSERIREIFKNEQQLGEIAQPRQGMATADNKRFLRFWHEVDKQNIGFGMRNRDEAQESNKTWFPYNKGGAFRKWYGNNEYVVNWRNDGEEIKKNVIDKYPYLNGNSDFVVKNQQFYFREGITWTKITSSTFSVRYSDYGFIFSDAGMKVFISEDLIGYLCAFLNSKLVNKLLGALSETMNYEQGNIERLPLIITDDYKLRKKIEELYAENIVISKHDWDSFETSWDFKKHPLLSFKKSTSKIAICSDFLNANIEDNFQKLKQNEEMLNNLFGKIYRLENEMTSEIDEEDITINRGDKKSTVKTLISYAIGCLFGRFSLDEEGLIFAGGEFIPSRYKTLNINTDNVVPILSGTYFKDDIVSSFIDFIKFSFGEEELAENLEFIASSLGKKKEETAPETIRRYFLNDFFKDHVQTYKKRPIYWLFTSGKLKAFNCLIYMHRYDKTTLSKIRTDYLHEYQIRLDEERKSLVSTIEGDSTAKEIRNAKQELKVLDKKIEELKAYDELIHHMADMQIEIDLDDGVVVNYEKFKGLVAKFN